MMTTPVTIRRFEGIRARWGTTVTGVDLVGHPINDELMELTVREGGLVEIHGLLEAGDVLYAHGVPEQGQVVFFQALGEDGRYQIVPFQGEVPADIRPAILALLAREKVDYAALWSDYQRLAAGESVEDIHPEYSPEQQTQYPHLVEYALGIRHPRPVLYSVVELFVKPEHLREVIAAIPLPPDMYELGDMDAQLGEYLILPVRLRERTERPLEEWLHEQKRRHLIGEFLAYDPETEGPDVMRSMMVQKLYPEMAQDLIHRAFGHPDEGQESDAH
jgi:hypothetical protein